MFLVSLVSVTRTVPLSVCSCVRPYVQRPSSRSHAYGHNIPTSSHFMLFPQVLASSSRMPVVFVTVVPEVLEPSTQPCYEEASDVNSVVPASAHQRRVLKYAHVFPS